MINKMSYISQRDAKRNINTFMQSADIKQNSRNYDILLRIMTYFSYPGRLDDIIPYIEESGNAMSLRDFEAFNVHVSAWINAHFYKEEVIPGSDGKKRKRLFIIYQNYKAHLKSYNKETFDPFRRGMIFEFQYTHVNEDNTKETKSIFTTICQMNYFLWCHNNQILDYIRNNLELVSETIMRLDAIKKQVSRERFKELIMEKQRVARYFENELYAKQNYTPIILEKPELQNLTKCNKRLIITPT